jgi:hypothetical protein
MHHYMFYDFCIITFSWYTKSAAQCAGKTYLPTHLMILTNSLSIFYELNIDYMFTKH